jgi:hypothetical protein
MNYQGVQLQLLIGPTVPTPPPPLITQALERVEVTHDDTQRSGFQLRFRAGGGPIGMGAAALLQSPLFQVFNRVVLTVTFRGRPHVLMDGVITNQQLAPGRETGSTILTLTGEDVSLMMDLEEKSALHPAQDEMVIALKLIASYAQYGLIPTVIPPALVNPPLPVENIPSQQETDLAYLQTLAERHGYVFYVTPGPAPLTNTAYWGPPVRAGVPQKALSVDMGPYTNVDSLDFQHDALQPTLVEGRVQDRRTNQTMPVRGVSSTRTPLSSQPTAQVYRDKVRRTQFRGSGIDGQQALARAQAQVNRSTDEVLRATGELDAMRYGDVLRPRGLVGLRGAGILYDGNYYVKRVTHTLSKGDYRQRFTLTRDGLGTTTPTVRP